MFAPVEQEFLTGVGYTARGSLFSWDETAITTVEQVKRWLCIRQDGSASVVAVSDGGQR
jgi:hypothetical protein